MFDSAKVCQSIPIPLPVFSKQNILIKNYPLSYQMHIWFDRLYFIHVLPFSWKTTETRSLSEALCEDVPFAFKLEQLARALAAQQTLVVNLGTGESFRGVFLFHFWKLVEISPAHTHAHNCSFIHPFICIIYLMLRTLSRPWKMYAVNMFRPYHILENTLLFECLHLPVPLGGPDPT